MVKRAKKIIDRKEFNTIVLASVLVVFIGWAAAEIFGVVKTVDATEDAQAALREMVGRVEVEVEEVEAKHDLEITEINKNLKNLSDQVNYMAGAVDFMARKQGYEPKDRGE